MLVLIQYREGLAGAHEVFVLMKKLDKWGLPYSKVVVFNLANADLDIQVVLDFVRQSNAVIFGGSGEFGFYLMSDSSKLGKKFRYVLKQSRKILDVVFNENVPSLGICFGHQLMGWYLGAQVLTEGDKYKEFGAHKIKLTEQGQKDLLFKKVPSEFYTSLGHKSAVVGLPKQTRFGQVVHLAYSNKIKCEAFRVNNQYGVQFHPELTYEENIERDNLYGGMYAPDVREAKDAVKPYISGQIIANFCDMFCGK